jgi:hypothetical protein
MTEHTDDQLEEQLPALTRWEGDAPGLWRRALRASGGRGMSPWQRLLGWPIPGVAAAAVVLVAIVAGGLMLVYGPGMGSGEQESRQFEMHGGNARQLAARPAVTAPGSPIDGRMVAGAGADHVGRGSGRGGGGAGGFGGGSGAVGRRPPTAPSQPLPVGAETLEPDRHVVRKATIELETDDVRALFLKAAQLVSEAGGEYVESSALTGSGRNAQANLTIRVRADRLSEVLNALRQLGTVESEQSSSFWTCWRAGRRRRCERSSTCAASSTSFGCR